MVTSLLVMFLASAQLGSAAEDPYTAIFNPDQLAARSLKRFTKSQPDHSICWNRSIEADGFISPIDTHNHFRPFGGPAVPFNEYLEWMHQHGILFTTMFGIGQKMVYNKNKPDCCYYGHCPTTEYKVVPDPENDIKNAEDYTKYKKNETQYNRIHLKLSATFPNLQDAEGMMDIFDNQLAKPFPGAFQWAGEINVFKHALAPNGFFGNPRVTVASVQSGVYDKFFFRMRDEGSPVTLHCDLGCDVQITTSDTNWNLQKEAYKTVQDTCAPTKEEVDGAKNPENVKFWKEILTREDGVSHYNAFFDKNTHEPKANFRKIQHLQVWNEFLKRFNQTTIVWAHIGLSKELRTLHPQVHSDIMANLFKKYDNLYADVSWDILAKLLLMNFNAEDKAENHMAENHMDLDKDTAAFVYNHTHIADVRTNLHNEWLTHIDYVHRTGSTGRDSNCKKGVCGPTHAMAMYLNIFEKYSDRFVTGTDYVASYGLTKNYPGQKTCPKACPTGCKKTKTNHARQVTDTSSINIFLSNKAFKKIVLGENYFRITGLSKTYAPPPICGAEEEAGLNIGIIVGILVGLVILLLILVGICCYLRKKEPSISSTAGMTVTSGGQESKSGATTAV